MKDNIENIKLNKSTESGDKSILYKRARAKYFTLSLIFNLLNLDSPLKSSYWSTYHCATQLIETGGKITSKYCKNRWCLVCNRIRTAVNIKKYVSEVASWGDNKYFVTLTKPTVTSGELTDNINSLYANFKLCVRAIQRTHKIDFKAIRKLECTYNAIDDKYHAHFHCIVYGKLAADTLKSEWLKRYPEAKDYLQDVRECNTETLMELFKYFTKIITPSNSKVKNKEENGAKIYIRALDNIFQSMRNKRTFQNYGFVATDVDATDSETVEVANFLDKSTDEIMNEVKFWIWKPGSGVHDWVNPITGELKTGYIPQEALAKLLAEVDTS